MNNTLPISQRHTKFNKVKKIIRQLDPQLAEHDDAFKVAVILIFAARYGQHMDEIYKHLPYTNDFINQVVLRLKENKIFVDGKIQCNWFDEQGGAMEFWMDVNVGLGFMERA